MPDNPQLPKIVIPNSEAIKANLESQKQSQRHHSERQGTRTDHQQPKTSAADRSQSHHSDRKATRTDNQAKPSADATNKSQPNLSDRKATRTDYQAKEPADISDKKPQTTTSDKGKPMLQRSERQATRSDNQAKSPSDVPGKNQPQASDRQVTRTNNQGKTLSDMSDNKSQTPMSDKSQPHLSERKATKTDSQHGSTEKLGNDRTVYNRRGIDSDDIRIQNAIPKAVQRPDESPQHPTVRLPFDSQGRIDPSSFPPQAIYNRDVPLEAANAEKTKSSNGSDNLPQQHNNSARMQEHRTFRSVDDLKTALSFGNPEAKEELKATLEDISKNAVKDPITYLEVGKWVDSLYVRHDQAPSSRGYYYEIDKRFIQGQGYSDAAISTLDKIFQETGFAPQGVQRDDYQIRGSEDNALIIQNVTKAGADRRQETEDYKHDQKVKQQAWEMLSGLLTGLAGIAQGKQQFQSVRYSPENNPGKSVVAEVGPPGKGVTRSQGQFERERGLLREEMVAKVIGGKLARNDRGKDLEVGVTRKVPIDVLGPNGEYVVVGGYAKAQDAESIQRESTRLGNLKKAASEATPPQKAMAVYSTDTPKVMITRAKKILGEDNVFLISIEGRPR
jgi:hypothetical protein